MTIPTNVPKEIFEYAEQGNQFWICFFTSFTVFDLLPTECFLFLFWNRFQGKDLGNLQKCGNFSLLNLLVNFSLSSYRICRV
ncbi:hypothetical protein DQM68_07950 [Leptospira mayottensis]|uniref:Uncharacterized protein n=2 Tax=Leptospira mayottensis TaxID=1137606 RepID=A0AA87MLR2_9LEPT|nr:hypothetical protein DQM68_07950 [Leptospira mayottensis]AXR64438.1 hypothetical protein DQM28_09630 [Leptospira mayottensis]AZQ03848.1 hypothetical protein LEP1GSC190_13735 [Leptospira mayottensis 200901116]EKR98639.1 hypothetical protein LEP1GSC125_1747 [Leptospira mayottensis 200901122]TGM95644.1 hypothetical protein EHR03_16190 [Leptospira mayottensis]